MAQKKKKEVVQDLTAKAVAEVYTEVTKPELYNVSVYNLVGKVESFRGVECLVDSNAILITIDKLETVIPFSVASKIVIQKA